MIGLFPFGVLPPSMPAAPLCDIGELRGFQQMNTLRTLTLFVPIREFRDDVDKVGGSVWGGWCRSLGHMRMSWCCEFEMPCCFWLSSFTENIGHEVRDAVHQHMGRYGICRSDRCR
jgi:hypothetical protein